MSFESFLMSGGRLPAASGRAVKGMPYSIKQAGQCHDTLLVGVLRKLV